MTTRNDLIAAEFLSLAVEFDRAGASMAKSHHLAVGINRIAERAGKLVFQSLEIFEHHFGPVWSSWLHRRRDWYIERHSRPGCIVAICPGQTWIEVVKDLVLDRREEFNDGDFDLLSEYWAGREVIPWPQWWLEKSADERRQYEKDLELQRRGELGHRIPVKGHDVVRPKPKRIPNLYAHHDEADEADQLALLRERASLHARACRCFADLAGGPGLPTTGRRSLGDVEKRVSEHIRARRAKGTPIEKITRDGIAGVLKISTGAVSSTHAWQALRDEKRRSRLPDTPDDALMAAAKRDDWDAVTALQRQEDRRNRPSRQGF